MTEKFKILAKYIKDMSSETPDIETYIFVKDNISKYQLNIDIQSKALKNKLVEINTTEHHKDDYFVLGELMIEITPDFIEDLRYYYDADTEDLLNGFFLGDWVDETYGQDTTITLSYQTIRTKSWNNRWYLEQGWGSWIAETEIYTAFWTIDGVLATLDAAGKI